MDNKGLVIEQWCEGPKFIFNIGSRVTFRWISWETIVNSGNANDCIIELLDIMEKELLE